jgi:hypothetical protein
LTEKTDWKIKAVLDREAITGDINNLVKILARQRVNCVVSANNVDEALIEAKKHLQRYAGIPEKYLKALHPRRLPT